METVDKQRIRVFNREHRVKLRTVAVIVVTKKVVVPLSAYSPEDLLTAMMQRKFPSGYKAYLRLAKHREPKVYNGNYASTINSFSLGFRSEQCR